MMKFLLALAFLASTSLSVQSADNEEAQIDRLRNFLQSGFSLEDIIGDDSQLRSEISRRLSVFMGKARGFDGHRLRDGVDPEVKLNAEGIVRRWGYPSEHHEVKTEDGYLLTVFRIPHGINGTRPGARRPAVFLQHGLLCSSSNWITNLPNESLAFVLADAGFDVWMGNMRGNTYSRRHTKLSPSSDAFWRFSWDEMAKYDLPSMIDYVVNVTKQPKIFYAGHSQGTLIMFAQLSRSPAFASRIRHFFALGPVATVGHLKSAPIRVMSLFQNLIEDLFRIFGVREFLPNDEILDWLARGLCTWETRIFCSDLLFVISGYDPQQLNTTRLPVYISHTPAGTSVQNMIHFAQMVRSNKFQMYDYGNAAENVLHYNQSTPPLYDISAINVNTSLYWGGKDLLADPRDVQESIVDKMRSITDYVFLDHLDHLDFIWGLDANPLVYQHILKKLRSLI